MTTYIFLAATCPGWMTFWMWWCPLYFTSNHSPYCTILSGSRCSSWPSIYLEEKLCWDSRYLWALMCVNSAVSKPDKQQGKCRPVHVVCTAIVATPLSVHCTLDIRSVRLSWLPCSSWTCWTLTPEILRTTSVVSFLQTHSFSQNIHCSLGLGNCKYYILLRLGQVYLSGHNN